MINISEDILNKMISALENEGIFFEGQFSKLDLGVEAVSRELIDIINLSLILILNIFFVVPMKK